jgi:dipeptide/tripeptide permease
LTIAFIVAFGRPLREYYDELAIYFAALVVAFSVPLFFDETRSRFSAAIRLLYPGILFAVFYRTTGGTMFLLIDHFLDNQIVAFETAVYGIEPTIYIDKHLLQPVLNELFSDFCFRKKGL